MRAMHRLLLVILPAFVALTANAADTTPKAATGRAVASRDSAYKLIAHRGGVVEDKFPDNSAAALKAAVDRGYWMIEVDIRETKDGELVMRHDADLKAYYGDARRVHEATWNEIRGLRSDVAGQSLWRFEDMVKAARAGGVRLMLDSKDPHSPDFVRKLEVILARHEMLAGCYVIGTADALNHFAGKALVGLKFRALRPKIESDPTLKDRYFLFEQGTTITEEMVKWAQARGIKVVPSINTYHYYDAKTMTGKSRAELGDLILPQARKHIEWLKALGVTEFQIDSEFDGWFPR
jgi:hypothetical protein